MKDLDILYEDEDILVCYKNAGVPTQTKRLGQQDLESILKNYRAGKKEVPYIGIVHRLDQPVEGVLVFGKNQKATASLSKQVKERTIGKHYYALVWDGDDANLKEKGVLEDYLVHDAKNNTTRVSDKADAQAKLSKLEYRMIAKREGTACVDILLHTGRHHQIRVQFANAKAPLLGDRKYGSVEAKNLALCSYRIEFKHPKTGKNMDFCVLPKGEEFSGFLDNIKNME